MTGGEYLKLNLVYIGRKADARNALNYDYLFYSDMSDDAMPLAARLDVTAGWLLSEIRKHKAYPKMLTKFRSKMLRQGYALLGKVIDEGVTGDDNYVGVWAPRGITLPRGVETVQQDRQVIMSPRPDSDGVLGEYSRVLLGKKAVNETRMTHGYSYGTGQFDIGIGSPLHKPIRPET